MKNHSKFIDLNDDSNESLFQLILTPTYVKESEKETAEPGQYKLDKQVGSGMFMMKRTGDQRLYTYDSDKNEFIDIEGNA